MQLLIVCAMRGTVVTIGKPPDPFRSGRQCNTPRAENLGLGFMSTPYPPHDDTFPTLAYSTLQRWRGRLQKVMIYFSVNMCVAVAIGILTLTAVPKQVKKT